MPRKLVLVCLATALVVGAAAGTAIALLGRTHTSVAATADSTAAATWPAGARLSPAFALHDANGRPLTLASLRGRAAVVTFLDPLCRNLCPIEAQTLEHALAALPVAERPAVVAVSVNVFGNARADLATAFHKWRVGPEWRWAIGSPAALAATWQRYSIGVSVATRTIAGITVHNVSHTEAAYVIDKSGHQRALFVWPYDAAGVARELASLARA